MKITELPWFVESDEPDDEVLLDIQECTVALLIRGRNAWHSTWVRHFLRNATMYPDVESAKAGAESKRGPGNVFYIVEVPALLLLGAATEVVLCDVSTSEPFASFTGFDVVVHDASFGSWIDGLYPGVSLRDASRCFDWDSGKWGSSRPNRDSMRRGRLPSAVAIGRSSQLVSMASESLGSQYLLFWRKTSEWTHYSRTGAASVSDRWRELVEEQLGSSQESVDFARRRQAGGFLTRTEWRARQESENAEARARLATTYAEWEEAFDGLLQAERKLDDAHREVTEAAEARLHPASSSTGIRAQRERYEAALGLVAVREKELVAAKELEATKLDKYKSE